MQLDLIKSKKFPRLFLAHPEDSYQVIPEVQLLWPDRSISLVLDLSYSGLAVSSAGLLGKIQLGQYFELNLKLDRLAEPLPLKLRVVRMTSQMVGFVIDTMAYDGRIKLDQVIKDQLVVRNMRLISPRHLSPQLQSDVWYHGPFDTNFFLWMKKDKAGLEKAIVEYDNLVWIYDHGKISYQKSQSATEEIKGYGAPLIEAPSQKVWMGASWVDRLVKVMEQVPDSEGYLRQALQILRLQRDQ